MGQVWKKLRLRRFKLESTKTKFINVEGETQSGSIRRTKMVYLNLAKWVTTNKKLVFLIEKVVLDKNLLSQKTKTINLET